MSDALDWSGVADHPAWAGFHSWLKRLTRDRFPTLEALDALLPATARNTDGERIRFVDPADLPAPAPGTGYEEEIAATGRVSTRPGSLHDLCNALVWARFPRLKAAMNRRHLLALPESTPGRRGPVRDALTGFDECGLVVTCPRLAPLDALAANDWDAVFGRSGEGWAGDLGVHVVGHANLEKLWNPYKAMTGRCLLLQSLEADPGDAAIDAAVATLWGPEGPLRRPGDFSPLPFMGIPGWSRGPQYRAFYDDPEVFRAPPPGRSPAPVFSWPA